MLWHISPKVLAAGSTKEKTSPFYAPKDPRIDALLLRGGRACGGDGWIRGRAGTVPARTSRAQLRRRKVVNGWYDSGGGEVGVGEAHVDQTMFVT